MKDVGYAAAAPPDNPFLVSWYEGNGRADAGDWDRSATPIETIHSPHGQSFGTIPIDVTKAASSFSHTGASSMGFRFEPGSPKSFEDFGSPASFNYALRPSLVVSDDPLDVFRNPAGLDVTASRQSPNIDIHFTPKNSLGQAVSLSSLEQELGIDGFNWISRVIEFPDSWQRTEIWKDLDWKTDSSGNLVPDAYWDPSAGFFRHSSDDSPIIAYPVGEGMIDLPPRQSSGESSTFMYLTDAGTWVGWDPDPAVTGLAHDTLNYYYGLGSTPMYNNEIGFHDRPLQPVGSLLPGEHIGWETELVGVRSDGSALHSGLFVDWESDALANGLGGITYGGSTSRDLREYVSGGVFNVHIRVVPEPATLILGLIGAVFVNPWVFCRCS